MATKMLNYVQPLRTLTVAEALTTFRSPEGWSGRVQIVRPSVVVTRTNLSVPLAMPLGPAYLAATLERAGYPVAIIDGVGEAPDTVRPLPGSDLHVFGLSDDEMLAMIDPDAAIIGFSLLFSSQWVQNRELIRRVRAKAKGAFLVAGGEHATALPEYTLRDCRELDAVVTGEGEVTFLELVHAVATGRSLDDMPGVHRLDADGRYLDGGLSRRVKDLANLPRPAWHLVRVDSYRSSPNSQGINKGFAMPMLATRGCPFQCTFCSNPTMWTPRYVMRAVEDVADEAAALARDWGARGVFLCDLTALTRKAWILNLCRELERRAVDLIWQMPSGTRSEALDEETLRALHRVNCRDISFAAESGSPRTLARIKKMIDLDKLLKTIKTAVALGHTTKVNLIIGFPFEQRRDVYRTLLLNLKLAVIGVTDAFPWVFSPYPGSELYREMRAQGLVPPPSDDYFLSLNAISDPFRRGGNGGSIPLWELNLYRIVTTLAFYTIAYTLRPRRLAVLARGLLGRRFQASTLLEQRLLESALRWRRRLSLKRA